MGDRFSIREITSLVIQGASSDGEDFEIEFDLRGRIPSMEISCDQDGYSLRVESGVNSMSLNLTDKEPDWDSDVLNDFLNTFQVQTQR